MLWSAPCFLISGEHPKEVFILNSGMEPSGHVLGDWGQKKQHKPRRGRIKLFANSLAQSKLWTFMARG